MHKFALLLAILSLLLAGCQQEKAPEKPSVEPPTQLEPIECPMPKPLANSGAELIGNFPVRCSNSDSNKAKQLCSAQLVARQNAECSAYCGNRCSAELQNFWQYNFCLDEWQDANRTAAFCRSVDACVCKCPASDKNCKENNEKMPEPDQLWEVEKLSKPTKPKCEPDRVLGGQYLAPVSAGFNCNNVSAIELEAKHAECIGDVQNATRNKCRAYCNFGSKYLETEKEEDKLAYGVEACLAKYKEPFMDSFCEDAPTEGSRSLILCNFKLICHCEHPPVLPIETLKRLGLPLPNHRHEGDDVPDVVVPAGEGHSHG